MRIDAWGGSEVGLVRTRNEDAFALQPGAFDPTRPVDRALFAVADGMGGHPGGDVAARLAIAAVVDPTSNGSGSESEPECLARMHEAARSAIEAQARLEPQLSQMGTTLTVALLTPRGCWINHVGDTRLYWIRGSAVSCVTRDHTVAQEMVDAGRLDSAASEGHPMGNVLTRCLGVCPDQHADRLEHPLVLMAGDLLVLATDGLAKTVSQSELRTLVAAPTAAEAARALLDASLANGAPDNTTVIVVRVLEPPAPPEPGLLFPGSAQ